MNDTLDNQSLTEFFPPIEPYETGLMIVDAPHQIYWEQSGNPDGVPVVVLHGGPGGGCSPALRQFFDPAHYRIILFDQRGCGKSTPLACLDKNTIQDLINDIEQLRAVLNIEKWHVFGGSWGSTLALSYAAQQADRCLSLTLRGIFLMEQSDIDWFMDTNKHVFPEAWEKFSSVISKDKRHKLLSAYYEIFTGDDDDKKLDAAIQWDAYEGSCAHLIPNNEAVLTQEQKDKALSIAMIECHYFMTEIISDEDSLLKKVDAFRHIPATIIQGRYDMICPIISAHKLHNVWPEAEYIIATQAGHSAFEPALRSHLINTTQKYKSIK